MVADSESPFASILFVPICSKCGNKLHNSSINYKEEYLDLPGETQLGFKTKNALIEPNKCPYCGALFDQISVPKPQKVGLLEIKMINLQVN